MKRLVALVLFAVLLAQSAQSQALVPRAYLPIIAGDSGNLAQNPSFEQGNDGECLWWDIAGFERHDCPQEVRPAKSWAFWWLNQEQGICAPHRTGQPEAAVFDVDPFRVASGARSFRYFTFFRCHHAGLLQRHIILRSGFYRASAQAQAWYGSCDAQPYYPGEPLDENCNEAPWANLTIRVGIGVNMGFDDDPRSDLIQWGEWTEGYNEWVTVESPAVPIAAPSFVRVFIESRSDAPLKHNDVYLDDVRLWQQK